MYQQIRRRNYLLLSYVVVIVNHCASNHIHRVVLYLESKSSCLYGTSLDVDNFLNGYNMCLSIEWKYTVHAHVEIPLDTKTHINPLDSFIFSVILPVKDYRLAVESSCLNKIYDQRTFQNFIPKL